MHQRIPQSPRPETSGNAPSPAKQRDWAAMFLGHPALYFVELSQSLGIRFHNAPKNSPYRLLGIWRLAEFQAIGNYQITGGNSILFFLDIMSLCPFIFFQPPWPVSFYPMKIQPECIPCQLRQAREAIASTSVDTDSALNTPREVMLSIAKLDWNLPSPANLS